MNKEQFNSAVRTGLSALGGYLMGKGWISAGGWDLVVGVALPVAAYGWSYIEKRLAAAK